MPSKVVDHPAIEHRTLETTFTGIEHSVSTVDARVHQYRGIKYASVPARFRQSQLFNSYPPYVDASKYGPICPQVAQQGLDEQMFGLSEEQIPTQVFKQNEFECLNLNITCPAGLNSESRIPVMVWIHGGGNRGSGSHWVYDGGALVHKSMLIDKPVILVSINYRLGVLGFAASSALLEDNEAAGDDGVGNYGLRDQRQALHWVHRYITEFGGDPHNVTLFGESTGASDILCHLLSSANERRPLFQRAILQSALVDHNIPDVPSAGWHLSRLMSTLRVHTLDQLRSVELDKLLPLGYHLRATDDGVFFRKDWKELISPEKLNHVHHMESHNHNDHPSSVFHDTAHHIIPTHADPRHAHHHNHSPPLAHSRPLQPIIIGDTFSSSHLYSLPASLWTPDGVVRRIRAVCQSLNKASALLRAYDIASHTDPEDLPERLLDLITDARLAWPTECVANGIKQSRGGHGVWRYVFDQEGPGCGPVDLAYVFDNIPLPESAATGSDSDSYPSSFGDFSDEEDDEIFDGPVRGGYDDPSWGAPVIDHYAYARVRDAVQERWIDFTYGEAPWNEKKVFVFGPEGETGERSWCIFEGRRRRQTWKEALEPLGVHLVQKVGIELSNGPPVNHRLPF